MAYTSVQGPWLPWLEYCSSGAKPCFRITETLFSSPAENRAAPKSSSLLSPPEVMEILSGLMSRWVSPRPWTRTSASMMGSRMVSAWSQGILPPWEAR